MARKPKDSDAPRLTWVQRQHEKTHRMEERELLKHNPQPVLTKKLYEWELSRFISRGWEVVEVVADLGGNPRPIVRIDRVKLAALIASDEKVR